MKLQRLLSLCAGALLCLSDQQASAQQLKLGTNPTLLNKDALLELNTDKQGLLLPRVSKSQLLTGGALYAAADGMFVYVPEEASLYLKKSGAWQKVADFGNSLVGDVAISTPANDEVLTFDQPSGKWINKAMAAPALTVNAPLAGSGTVASPLKISSGTVDGQVLKWNGTVWSPGDDLIGGTAYGTLTSADITGATSTDAQFRLKIWKGPGAKVTNGPDTGPTGAAAWSVLSFQNSAGANNYTTQMYFDKNTLALKEWSGGTALTDNGNPWYKVVTTLGSNIFTPGGLMFANVTTDATSEVAQDAANLFWDKTNKELGLKTNTPAATLDVNGTVKLGEDGTAFSGMLTGTGSITVTQGSYTYQNSYSYTFSFPNAVTGSVVMVSPTTTFGSISNDLKSVGVAYAYVPSNGNVRIVLMSGDSYYLNSAKTITFNVVVINK